MISSHPASTPGSRDEAVASCKKMVRNGNIFNNTLTFYKEMLNLTIW